MTEDRDTYDATKARLEDIVVAVRRKDTSLEKSIDLLEEGVRLANLCTEQVDAVGSMLETMRGPDDAAGAEVVPSEEDVAGDVADAADAQDDAGEADAAEADAAVAPDDGSREAEVDAQDEGDTELAPHDGGDAKVDAPAERA